MIDKVMPIESQKYMALEGVHTWIRSLVLQGTIMDSSTDRLIHSADGLAAAPSTERIKEAVVERRAAMRDFQIARHLFVVSASNLVRYANWVIELDFVARDLFAELESLQQDISEVRNMNEHVIEYFKGTGRFQSAFVHSDEDCSADASSTVGDLLGGRLNWRQVMQVAENLSLKLPAQYEPDTAHEA